MSTFEGDGVSNRELLTCKVRLQEACKLSLALLGSRAAVRSTP